MAQTIFKHVLENNILFSSHESDLYIPLTAENKQLLKDFKLTATTFRNNVDGKIWYDIPFQYDPYWEDRGIAL